MQKAVITFILSAVAFVYLTIVMSSENGYGGLIIFVLVSTALAVAVLLIMRYFVKVEKTIVLKERSVSSSLRASYAAIWGAEDSLFAYPSGKFEFSNDATEPNVLVAREFISKQGGGQYVMNFIKLPWFIAMGITGFLSLFGIWGFLIGFILSCMAYVIFVGFFIVPLLLAWLVDTWVKPRAKSEIVITAHDKGNDTELTIVFKGISALLVKGQVLAAFTPAQLPARFQAYATAPKVSATSRQSETAR